MLSFFSKAKKLDCIIISSPVLPVLDHYSCAHGINVLVNQSIYKSTGFKLYALKSYLSHVWCETQLLVLRNISEEIETESDGK